MTSKNFCTLFDKNFLTRALALHASFTEHCPNFTLWILCMDDPSHDMLNRLQLANTKLLRLSEVEDARMLAVKQTRTPLEYCWMWSSALPLYLLENNPAQIDMIAYIDADLYFYASPDEIYRELGASSIMIIPHNYSPREKHREKTSGIYNVGMTVFRNNQDGLTALRWWKDRVIEWCYARYEESPEGGKFGDQLYLDDWPTRFAGVHVLENRGANVASWNIDTYDRARTPLIFYHFHGLKIYMNHAGKIKPYPVTVHDRGIYAPYISAIQRAYDQVRGLDPTWKFGCAKPLDIFRLIKQHIGL